LFHDEVVSWFGVAVCLVGVILFIWALFSFKKSFRIGLVGNVSEGLITTGAVAVSRNPIYLAFIVGLVGQFLVFSSWILFFYILGGFWLFRRQAVKEEFF
jgi:protein-S-isoprenylcysteine O-methyltransferase Ste14